MDYKSIKTLEDVYKVNKQDINSLPSVTGLIAMGLTEEEAKDSINHLQMTRLFRAMNTDQATGKAWEPNWADRDQWKYFIWGEVKATKENPGGVGFSRSNYDCWGAASFAGSRLCTDSSDKIYHMWQHFTPLITEYLLILKTKN